MTALNEQALEAAYQNFQTVTGEHLDEHVQEAVQDAIRAYMAALDPAPIDEPHRQRFKSGVRAAIQWLHHRATHDMNDPHAKAILNSAAFNLGVDLAQNRVKPRQAGGHHGA